MAAHSKNNGRPQLRRSDPKNSFDLVDRKIGSAIGLPSNYIKQKIFNLMPRTKAENPLSAFYNTFMDKSAERAMAQKHDCGLELFENPFKNVPILNKVVQNGWPVLNFYRGITTLSEIYAVVDEHGREIIIDMYNKGDKPDLHYIEQAGEHVIKQKPEERLQISGDVLNEKLKKALNIESLYSGFLEELTDEDISEVEEPEKFIPSFLNNELYLFEKAGKREVVSSKHGVKIVKYSRPSALNFQLFNSLFDFTYTAIDLPFQALESKYFKEHGLNIAKMRSYEKEIAFATELLKGFYGGEGKFYLGGNGYSGSHGGH